MGGNLPAGSAVLVKQQLLFFHVDLVPFGKIVLVLTDGTKQGYMFSRTFFCHTLRILPKAGSLNNREPRVGIGPTT